MSARIRPAWLLAVALLAPALAQAAIFSHVDPQSGLTIMSNVAREGAQGVTPPPAPRGVSAAPRAQGASSTGGAQAVAARTATPADFPRVSAARQQELDGDRRAILQSELSGEQRALAAAAAARAQGDVLHRHEANIAALQRELRAIR